MAVRGLGLLRSLNPNIELNRVNGLRALDLESLDPAKP